MVFPGLVGLLAHYHHSAHPPPREGSNDRDSLESYRYPRVNLGVGSDEPHNHCDPTLCGLK